MPPDTAMTSAVSILLRLPINVQTVSKNWVSTCSWKPIVCTIVSSASSEVCFPISWVRWRSQAITLFCSQSLKAGHSFVSANCLSVLHNFFRMSGRFCAHIMSMVGPWRVSLNRVVQVVTSSGDRVLCRQAGSFHMSRRFGENRSSMEMVCWKVSWEVSGGSVSWVYSVNFRRSCCT